MAWSRAAAAPGYFDGGVIQMGDMIRHPLGRTFYYMSTRNNDFTNRSQKASITVKAWKWALIIGSIVFAICAAVVWSCLIRRRLVRNPEHRLRTRCFGRSLVCIGRHWDRIYHKTWLYKAPWTVGLVTMCIVLFAIGYWRALGKDPAPSYAYAKACGQVLDFTCNLIFLPVLRNFMSWLRATPLRQLLPLNSGEEIYFHKVLFVLISLPGIGHVICHFLRYEWYAHFGTGDPIAEQVCVRTCAASAPGRDDARHAPHSPCPARPSKSLPSRRESALPHGRTVSGPTSW